ncbi:adenylate kinase family protein [Candidatus Fokinia crypta]|uniref:Adenylate kinase n=1 Tax=Candidatus Fokinia crypta TaxID=1920990 RepID=A0ABZ0URQ0_9RICK|nr:nucleoside monophosphate kinase [Candidatus Fokinia cryptica]WPX97560.1 Adenylate kinase [Candidatus Fokinia cryptica]
MKKFLVAVLLSVVTLLSSCSPQNTDHKTSVSENPVHRVKIVLLGAPGSGKGTFGAMLSSQLNIPILSMGSAMREYFKSSTNPEIAQLQSGKLLDDKTVTQILKQKLLEPQYANGVILDGYPRTVAQGLMLDEALGDRNGSLIIVNVNATLSAIEKRSSGRFMCAKCDAIYNIYSSLPKVHDKSLDSGKITREQMLARSNMCTCDHCGSSKFYARKDDTRKVILYRYCEYRKNTLPLIKHYQKYQAFFDVDGNCDISLLSKQAIDLAQNLRPLLALKK